MKKTILILSFLPFLAIAKEPMSRPEPDAAAMHALSLYAIQAGGRVKPFDTFAREGIELLRGKSTYEGRSAVETVLSMVAEPKLWEDQPLFQISHLQLKRDLALDDKKSFFSLQEIAHSVRLMPLFQELDAKQRGQEKLNPYFQAVQRLGNQLNFVSELVSGKLLRFVPPTPEEYAKSDAWKSLGDLSDELKLRFTLIAATYVSEDPATRARMADHAATFQKLAKAQNEKLYPAEKELVREYRFNKLHPFRWAWVFALLAAVLLSFAVYSPRKELYAAGMGLFGVSFVLQTYGFLTRCLIAGRPPVSNMYESILWVAFGCMLFGLILELIYRKRIIAIGSLIFCTIALLVADNISGILDDGIHPLEPVLRSNLWLSVHVLTITLGYAAFALSLILGNLGLGQIAFFGRESERLPTKTLAFFAYRAVQVGVVLLAAGTILGGVWADYSWGRFWGWDPKETWALIALLGYVALIHARFRGMVRPFGFLAGCVLAFMGVLMAWYGVNFVLGVGKHSYGFSSGGVGGVSIYVALQLAFVFYALWFRRKMQSV